MSFDSSELGGGRSAGAESAALLPLANGAKIQQIATGATNAAFPIWLGLEQVVRFSDLGTNKSAACTIQLDYATGETVVWKSGTGRVTGSAHHPDLGIAQGSFTTRAIEKAPLVPFLDSEILIDTFEGVRLNGPYALAVHPQSHDVWFTDPPLALLSGSGANAKIDVNELGYGRSYVFSLDHHGDLTAQITELGCPVALAFEVGGKRLFVANDRSRLPQDFNSPDGVSAVNRVLPDQAGAWHLWVFELADDYRVKKGSGKVFAELRTEKGEAVSPLSLVTDAAGRLWAGSAWGLHVFSADASPLGSIKTPDPVTGMCFGGAGGSELIFTGTTGLFRLLTTTSGAELDFAV